MHEETKKKRAHVYAFKIEEPLPEIAGAMVPLDIAFKKQSQEYRKALETLAEYLEYGIGI